MNAKILSLEDRSDAAKWSDATPVWSEGGGNELRIVYASTFVEESYLAYSAEFGYVGPFGSKDLAIAATKFAPDKLSERVRKRVADAKAWQEIFGKDESETA